MTMMAFAHHIIAVAHDNGLTITNLQLQKIMYFSLQDALRNGTLDRHIIEDNYDQPFLVWRYGPVEREVYDAYKVYGADSITEQSEISDVFNPLNNEIISLLQRNPFELVKVSHLEPFWREHSNEIVGWRSNTRYGLDDIMVG